jgi:hypothetical protein
MSTVAATNPTLSGLSQRKFKTVRFYTTKYVLNLTRALSQTLLREIKILTSDIVCDTPLTFETVQRNRMNPTELLFILIPQLMVSDASALPDPGKYCIYQLEQLNDKNGSSNKSGNVNETLIKTQFNHTLTALICNSIAAFDYSSVNLDYYPKSLRSKITVLPPPIYVIAPLPANTIIDNKPYKSDILFYGSTNPRRERILTRLTQTLHRRGHAYNVRSVSRLFGDELLQYVTNARIVLNIHFYANSILETDRIHTALQCDHVTVISEYPTQRDALLSLYESNPRIRFCEEICDSGDADADVAELAEACIKTLSFDNRSHRDQTTAARVGKLNELCAAELKRLTHQN